jgi:16S rRNA (adenine1518-N6/adenine1519-N6)-dimethyltransferase
MTRNDIRASIMEVLRSAGTRPRHRFGQNFMIEPRSLEAIIRCAELSADDLVLEVGPGPGNLTRRLAQNAGHVLAVDIDEQLLPAAQRALSDCPNITWLCTDALDGKHRLSAELLESLGRLAPGRKVKLVANLPYNIASPLVVILLSLLWRQLHGQPGGIGFCSFTFTVQLEVARRMTAVPDTSDYGALTVMIAAMADAQVVGVIPPGHFWPPPQIDSALVHLTPRPERAGAIGDFAWMESVVSKMFSHRRQTIANALRHSYHSPASMDALKLADPVRLQRRPGEWTAAELVVLANRLQGAVS